MNQEFGWVTDQFNLSYYDTVLYLDNVRYCTRENLYSLSQEYFERNLFWRVSKLAHMGEFLMKISKSRRQVASMSKSKLKLVIDH